MGPAVERAVNLLIAISDTENLKTAISAIPEHPEVYIPCMALRNHAACIGSYCDAVLNAEIVTSAAMLDVIAALHRDLCPAANHPNRT